MSRTYPGTTSSAPLRPVRVREQAREVAAVMAFSAVVSGALALALLILTTMGK